MEATKTPKKQGRPRGGAYDNRVAVSESIPVSILPAPLAAFLEDCVNKDVMPTEAQIKYWASSSYRKAHRVEHLSLKAPRVVQGV